MTAKTTTKKSGKTYVNYVCSTHKKTGECQNNNVSERKLSDIVLLAIRKQVASFMESREVSEGFAAAALKSRKQSAIEGMIERNLQVIKDNGDYLVKAYRHFADDIIAESEYETFKRSFNSQILTAEGNIAALRGELSRLEDDANAKRLIERFMEHDNITELNRRVVTGLIKSVTVNSSKEIFVNFRYASGSDMPYEAPEYIMERAVV